MFNSLADALDTLDQVGALKYTISQPGQMKLQQEADTTSELLDLFQRDWQKLTPGVYKVDYAKSKSDNKSALCFRVNKAPDAATVASVGSIGDGGQLLALQQQIWQLQAASQLRDLEDKHRREMDDLKARLAKKEAISGPEIGLDTLPGILAGIDKIHDTIRMAKGHPPMLHASAAVAGTPTLAAAPVAGQPLNDETNRLATALESLVGNLGDEAVLNALETLAAKAQANPEKVRSSLGYLNML